MIHKESEIPFCKMQKSSRIGNFSLTFFCELWYHKSVGWSKNRPFFSNLARYTWSPSQIDEEIGYLRIDGIFCRCYNDSVN